MNILLAIILFFVSTLIHLTSCHKPHILFTQITYDTIPSENQKRADAILDYDSEKIIMNMAKYHGIKRLEVISNGISVFSDEIESDHNPYECYLTKIKKEQKIQFEFNDQFTAEFILDKKMPIIELFFYPTSDTLFISYTGNFIKKISRLKIL